MTRMNHEKANRMIRGRTGIGSRESRPVDLEVKLHHETEKAILVSLDGKKDKATWLPRSACEFEPTGAHGWGKLMLSETMAFEKGLI